jgi:hypothetical protein
MFSLCVCVGPDCAAEALAHVLCVCVCVCVQALIVQLRPKECLVVAHDSSSDSRKLQQTLERSGVLVSERKRS